MRLHVQGVECRERAANNGGESDGVVAFADRFEEGWGEFGSGDFGRFHQPTPKVAFEKLITPTEYRSTEYRTPSLLLMGNEGRGLSAEILTQTDLAVSIPMRGTASSLNLAVATGLMLYEIKQ